MLVQEKSIGRNFIRGYVCTLIRGLTHQPAPNRVDDMPNQLYESSVYLLNENFILLGPAVRSPVARALIGLKTLRAW